MVNPKKKICILGTGGFGREVLCCIMDIIAGSGEKIEDVACFMVDDEYYRVPVVMGVEVIKHSQFDPFLHDVVVAIGDPGLRKAAVNKLPLTTTYATIIHPSVVLSPYVKIGEGSIITAGVILTCNITIGKHAHLNLNTTIGHDCTTGDFFTTAPAVNISGNCRLGNCVYFGTNSATREGVAICDDVVIGMGGVVLKDINEKGVYVGNPVEKLVPKSALKD